MKIGLFSDLHLEFWLRPRSDFDLIQYIADCCNSSDCDVIVNAGDTHPYPHIREQLKSKITKPYFDILGNHDFYGQQEFGNSMWVETLPNGLKIVGTTLWTNFGGRNAEFANIVYSNINDKYQIKNGSDAVILQKAFKESCEFIIEKQPDIVISHFMPFYNSIAPQFLHSGTINYYFCNDLNDFVKSLAKKPGIWMCGHTHWPHEYQYEGIRVYCNPLGYPNENTLFPEKDYHLKVIEA